MNYTEIVAEVLKSLFAEYEKDPNKLYDIAPTIRGHGQDPEKFGSYLADHGWVKDDMRYPNQFVCRITITGIRIADPDYFEQKKSDVIYELGTNGTKMKIMEILDLPQEQFQKAFDICRYLEMTGYIKQGTYTHGDITIELSDKGQEYYDENKPMTH